MIYYIFIENSIAEHKCASYSERSFFKTSIVAASLTSRGFCHTHGTDFFDYVDFFFFFPLLQFHMQSMHQPHPCYLLKQSFWNPIWGQCRLNKISFWFGLPLRMGLLCFSRQNQQARKVCPVLHGWWCDLRITIRPFMLSGLGISSTSRTVFLFSLPFAFLLCRLPSTCRAKLWQTLTLLFTLAYV